MLERQVINNTIEKEIITGMIVSDDFLKKIEKYYDSNLFSTDYIKIIGTWCWNYFKQYNKAPNRHIESIFSVEGIGYPAPTQENLANLLFGLSEEYDNKNFNATYLEDVARSYFQTKHLEQTYAKGQGLIQAGKPEKAKQIIENFREISANVSKITNPLDIATIRKYRATRDVDVLFRFMGPAGEFFEDFNRSWLVSFMGPEKRGKSMMLLEFMFQALFAKLKILYVSLEMSENDMYERIYQRLTARPESDLYDIIYPIMDCKKNQDGTCKRPQRPASNMTLLTGDDDKQEYDPKLKYKICQYCRIKNYKDFEPTIWYTHRKHIPAVTTKEIEKKAKTFITLFGNNMRFVSFPAMSANTSDVFNSYDELVYNEGFNADVMLVDYPEICELDDPNLSERGKIDKKWALFKGFAAKKNILMVVVEQGNKQSNERQNIKVTDVVEDKRKNAHVNAKYAINQTEEEIEMGIIRIGKLLHRSKKGRSIEQLHMFQCLALSQPLLDCYVAKVISTDKKGKGK